MIEFVKKDLRRSRRKLPKTAYFSKLVARRRQNMRVMMVDDSRKVRGSPTFSVSAASSSPSPQLATPSLTLKYMTNATPLLIPLPPASKGCETSSILHHPARRGIVNLRRRLLLVRILNSFHHHQFYLPPPLLPLPLQSPTHDDHLQHRTPDRPAQIRGTKERE
ncbi:hypothetical protein BD410DRAFT_631498 [Rickenella mellea]|uniref:Uncharacterized protein n=1 Tax=Rickenella mellea TaxID=50990 RepID=A0A4Y7QD82_9AGAM|nr:hypothetical protein BD410DRAFT_631498 [Rickenella mellea]